MAAVEKPLADGLAVERKQERAAHARLGDRRVAERGADRLPVEHHVDLLGVDHGNITDTNKPGKQGLIIGNPFVDTRRQRMKIEDLAFASGVVGIDW